METFEVSGNRSRTAWWGVVAVLGLALALFVWSFVGTFVLGLFIYYAVRPLHGRVKRVIAGQGLSAVLTILLVVVPAIALLAYVVTIAFEEFVAVAGPGLTDAILARLPGDPESIEVVLRSPEDLLGRLGNPSQLRDYFQTGLNTVGTIGNGLLHLTLSLAFAFFLLRDGPRLAGWFRRDLSEQGSVADAYLTAVDRDLATVYFGNVVTVMLVGVASFFVYNGFNLLAPAALGLPFPTLLALLTGLATFIPLIVGKVVYVPATALLLWQWWQADASGQLLAWVIGFLLVAFFLLDLFPQTFLRPYISGRTLHAGLILFAYVLGTALFGWYGLFLGPLLAVLVVQLANVVLPELLHGRPLTTATHTVIGSDPWDERVVGSGDGDQSTGEESDGTEETASNEECGGAAGDGRGDDA
ncbi:MAG: AI-2E family transporter [Haloarculaceae archaeon]